MPVSKDWTGNRALLVVHGVGNAQPGDYAPLVASIRQLLGDDTDSITIYELYYDVYNDWMNDKMPLAAGIDALKSRLKINFGGDELGTAAAEFAGDVLWPILHLASRAIVREVYLAQLKQIVLDGMRAGVGVWNQRLSILCHSLGCFHTYEALHAAADDPAHALRPLSNGVTFANVVFMASPVQLIRTVTSPMLALIPKPDELATVRGAALEQPGQSFLSGGRRLSARRWISITGDLDPVGGYLFRKRLDGAVMSIEGQESIVDDQALLNVATREELAQRLQDAVREKAPPAITASNPHSWQGYVDRHSGDLREWLLA
jgi:acyl dehydratase